MRSMRSANASDVSEDASQDIEFRQTKYFCCRIFSSYEYVRQDSKIIFVIAMVLCLVCITAPNATD